MVIGLVTSRISGVTVRGGGICVLAFDGTASDAQDMVDKVEEFWTTLATVMVTSISVAIDGDVPVINELNGGLSGLATAIAPDPIVGLDNNPPLPPANQGLIRWLTGGVKNNRLIRGRTFIPGASEEQNTGAGIPQAAYLEVLQEAATGLITGEPALVVYARPTEEDEGFAPAVINTTPWGEWAILRSRRD